MERQDGGNIIIAAHNEASVIGRTLDALAEVRRDPSVRVIVVCNGCTDETAAVARSRDGVIVAELAEASKIAALRAGDRRAGSGPRIYLDADITMTSRAARATLVALSGDALAGRPPHVFDTSGASWIVRSWYRIRQDLPSVSSRLWGAGCYAMSGEGRARFGEFPDLVSDDLFVDSLFAADEVAMVATDPLVVTTPRRLSDLVRILRRTYRTQGEVAAASGRAQGQRAQMDDLRALLRRSPRRVGDAAVYIAVIAWARLRARWANDRTAWERDASSRQVG